MNHRMTAKEVRQIRSDLKMTQKELGEAVGVRENTVWRWEAHGQSHKFPPEPTARLLRALHQIRTTPAKSRRRAV